MTRNAKAPAPVLVGLPCGRPSAWHSGTHVFPPEQHWRARSLSAHQARMSTRRQRRSRGDERSATKRTDTAAMPDAEHANGAQAGSISRHQGSSVNLMSGLSR